MRGPLLNPSIFLTKHVKYATTHNRFWGAYVMLLNCCTPNISLHNVIRDLLKLRILRICRFRFTYMLSCIVDPTELQSWKRYILDAYVSAQLLVQGHFL